MRNLGILLLVPMKISDSSHDALVFPGTPLHAAAKERNREAIKLLIENGAFLPADINDSRFNPPLHYCPGLEWAYELKLLQEENLSGNGSCSSES